MATLTLIYESIFSEKYRVTAHESIVIIFLLAVYNFSSYYLTFLAQDAASILTGLGFFYIGYVWFKTFANYEEVNLKFYILFEVLSRSYSKYFLHNTQLSNSKLLSESELNKLLFVFVKMFYIPLMLSFTINNFRNFDTLFFNLQYYRLSDFTIINWYKLLIPILFFFDAGYFLFGYLIESKKLGSTVRSVDKSAVSWIVTLACYPPFNNVSSELFPWVADQSNLFFPSTLNYILLVIVLILFVLYVSTTISLGSKCSNLTNRGTVSRGLYKYIRHPAYSTKVLAWWIMAIPVMNIFVFINMIIWTTIYMVRALKEEDHLLQDEEYQSYFNKTPNRFIPKLF